MLVFVAMFVFSVIVYFAVTVLVGYLIFSPFQHVAAAKRVTSRRFLMSDLLAIFLTFQMGFAGINYLFDDIVWNVSSAVTVSSSLLVLAFVSWLYGLRLLWRMDVEHWVKRIALLGVVMPGGFVVSGIAFPVLATSTSAFSVMSRLAIIAALVFAIRALVFWVESGSKGQDDMEVLDVGQQNVDPKLPKL